MVQLDGNQVKLTKGRKCRPEAERRFHELMLQRGTNPPPESPEPTVASIFETYLDSARKRLADRSFDERRLILQWFAEAHGFRKVAECLPYHLSSWIDANPQWATDWTIAPGVEEHVGRSNETPISSAEIPAILLYSGRRAAAAAPGLDQPSHSRRSINVASTDPAASRGLRLDTPRNTRCIVPRLPTPSLWDATRPAPV
jgi:hypothetical protein